MPIITILILATITSLATLFGVLLGRLFKKTKKSVIFSMSFAASLMILISAFELIPTAMKDLGFSLGLAWLALGIFLIWSANKIIPHLHSVKEIKSCQEKSLARMSFLIAIGLILHDFPEGFSIPGSFGYSESLGFIIVAVIFIHNIPEGYILTMSQKKNKAGDFCIKAALFSALATFLGAILGITLVANFQNLNPLFLSLAAGAMLFIAIHELLPESFSQKDARTFSLGIAAAAIIYLVMALI